MNKFEQLIEYVINDEDSKAQSLFHDIVVEKSRGIYEGLMDQDDNMGGDQVDELINDVESEERGFTEDDDEMAMEPGMGDMGDMGGDINGDEGMGDMGGEYGDEMGMDAEEGELEDRVVDLEDKLDELMAEFDSIVGDEEGMGDEFGGDDMEDMGDMGGDEFGADEMGGEMEPGMEESRMQQRRPRFESEEIDEDDDSENLEEELATDLEEAVSLTKVTKGILGKTEEAGGNTKTINLDNAGKKLTGGSGNPVNFGSTDEKGAGKVSYKDEGYTTEPRESKVTKGVANKSEEAGTDKQSLVKARK